MFRKIFIIPAIYAAEIAQDSTTEQAKKAKTLEETKTPKDAMPLYKCRPSELPIYEPVASKKDKKEYTPPTELHRIVEENVRAVRLQLRSVFGAVSDQKKKVQEIIDTGKAHTKGTTDYLQDPANKYQRIGAIAAGGVSGFILASIRGGFFKKLFYTAIGAGGVASICYPEEAKIYSNEALVQTKKGLSIAYNFALGVKPGDEVSYNNPLSKFPTNFDELSDLATDLYESAKETLFPSKK